MEFTSGYGTRDHEDDLIEFEARQRYDEEHGLELGDPRRCPTHGTIISSPCGRFDGLCGACEAMADLPDDWQEIEARGAVEAARLRETVAAMEAAARLAPRPAGGYVDDDIQF